MERRIWLLLKCKYDEDWASGDLLPDWRLWRKYEGMNDNTAMDYNSRVVVDSIA